MKTIGRRRTWTHNSVKALVSAAGGGEPEDIIRAKARDLVRWAKGYGWSGPPYDPLQLASLRGIKTDESQALFSAEAQLTPVDGRQLLLQFNPDRPESRRNYSVFHEIVHTFFDDCYEIVHQRKSNPLAFHPDHEVEQLCQIGAAELLMPGDDFAADLSNAPFSLKTVPQLAQRYAASREAVIRRMVHLGTRPCAAVFLSNRLSPKERAETQMQQDVESGPHPKMRVLYAVASDEFPLFIPPHKSVPDDSCMYQAVIDENVVEQVETWELPGFADWLVEAMALPTPPGVGEDVPSVLALVLPDSL